MTKLIFLYIMALLYLAAGINHFVNPKMYERIMPPWLPYPSQLNYLSGACEIIFALMLIPTTTRNMAAWLLIALLIAVYPANIQMSVNYWHYHNPNFWLTLVRLPLQFLLIWWAWQYT